MASQPIDYTLFYGMFSLCSMMVRYTIRVRGAQKSGKSTIFDEKHINIQRKEHMTEQYLLEVNCKGQVPALTSSALQSPIADSLLITKYLIEEFPQLAPSGRKQQILDLLDKLHGLNYYSLSYSGTNQFTVWLRGELEKILAGTISDEYRNAIEYKLGVIEHEYVGGLKEDTVDEMVKRARALLEEISALLPTGSRWLFGFDDPSALDAHLVPFLVRLKDVNRHELIPDNLRRYVDEAEKTAEWDDFMEGRSTYAKAEGIAERAENGEPES